MSAAAPRTISTTPDLRLNVAMVVLVLAVALLVAATISRQASVPAPAPAAVPAQAHDHGWSSTATSLNGPVLGADYGGGILYTGIPYFPANALNLGDQGPRERFAQ